MKKLYRKQVLLFCLPLVIPLAPLRLRTKYSGENYTDIDEVIARGDKYPIGYAYNESNYKYLKWKEVTTKPRQDVLAIGSSRILQIRVIPLKGHFIMPVIRYRASMSLFLSCKAYRKISIPNTLCQPRSVDVQRKLGSCERVETNKAKWENAFSKFPISIHR